MVVVVVGGSVRCIGGDDTLFIYDYRYFDCLTLVYPSVHPFYHAYNWRGVS